MYGVKEILAKARHMPLLSHSSMRLLELIGDENHTLQEMAKIIETDSALTIKTLKLVNSASFALREEISTVASAIPYIGEKLLVGLAINKSAPQVFNRPLLGYEGKPGELWAHGLRTAIAAGELAKRAKEKVNPGIAYTAGILHDIGKSVLSKFLSGSAPYILQKLEEEEVQDYIEAEEAIIGTNHCVIGGELAKHWKLPPPMQSVISHHHKPAEAGEEYSPLVYVIHVADIISMMGGTGTGSDNLSYSLDKKYSDYIAIDPVSLDDIIITVTIEFEKTYSALFAQKKEG